MDKPNSTALRFQYREPGEVELSSFRECPLCGKLFFAGIDLSDHLARHREDDR